MIEPQSEISIQAEIDAKKKLSIEVIIEYLDKHLPNFPNFFRVRFLTTYTTESEPVISQVLCTFLSTFRKSDEVLLFEFEREWKNSRYAVDFAVIDVKSFKETNEKPKPFFTIEAKRLPPPEKDSKGNSRKREYVLGKSGGIERYKRGKHGTKLPQSAVIGYIQKESCSHWHTKINEWINELSSSNTDDSIHWDSEDLLIQIADFNKTKKYTSRNTRIVGSITDSIFLYHYLMELN